MAEEKTYSLNGKQQVISGIHMNLGKVGKEEDKEPDKCCRCQGRLEGPTPVVRFQDMYRGKWKTRYQFCLPCVRALSNWILLENKGKTTSRILGLLAEDDDDE